MSQITDDIVKHGFWINWSHGRVLGATITTDATTGNVVIALLALIATTGAGHLWSLILFILHQSQAARTTGDAIFHQEQAIFRSLQTPSLIILDMIKLLLSWRKSGRTTSWHRLASIVLLASVFGVGAVLASVFSSKIIETSNIPVLITPNRCWVNWSRPHIPIHEDIMKHAKMCTPKLYSSGKPLSGCDFFVQPNILLSRKNVSCPLSSTELCTGTEPTAVVFDSGLLDSNDIFGINAPLENRILIRKRTTYAPLNTEGHMYVINSSEAEYRLREHGIPLPGEELFYFDYHTPKNQSRLPLNRPSTPLVYSTYTSNTSSDYTLGHIASFAKARGSPGDYPMISELRMPSADSFLLFIFSNSIASNVPVDDPVFSAHKAHFCSVDPVDCSHEQEPPAYNSKYYTADYPAGVLLTLQQYQFCLVNASGEPHVCTELSGHTLSQRSSLISVANDVQAATLGLFESLTDYLSLSFFLKQFFDLKASETNYGGRQTVGLPKDQWVTETFGFESVLWTAIQYAIAIHTSISPKLESYTFANDTNFPNHCVSQKVLKTGGFANINVLGLAVIVCISGFLTVLDISLLRFLIFLSKFRATLAPRIDRWVQDGVLQLQRRAYEANGFGPWQRVHDEEVPIYLGQGKLPTMFDPCNRRCPSSKSSTTALNFSDDFEPHARPDPQEQWFEFETTTQTDSKSAPGFWMVDNDKRTNSEVLGELG